MIYVWHILKETIPLIQLISKQWLDICQHNILTTSLLINAEAKGDIKKGDGSKSEDKDSSTGNTAGAHVEDTTKIEESTVPDRAPSIGAHVLERNVQSSNSAPTVKEILGAHPMDNDDFWGNTNPTDVSNPHSE